MSGNSGPYYKISCSQKELDRLKQWAERAEVLGFRPQYLAALREINQKLRTEPLRWGDPQYRIHHMGLLFCHGIHSIFHVYYAVDEQRRVVYVKEFKPLPGYPLEQQGES